MKIGKLIFGGAMASVLMMGAASADPVDDSLTTKSYVDGGLRAVYKATNDKLGDRFSSTNTVAAAIGALETAVGTGEDGLATKVKANTDAITLLNGTVGTTGSVANTVNAAITAAVAPGGTVNTAVTTGVTKLVSDTTARMQDQLGWDMSKSPDEAGSFADKVVFTTADGQTVVGAINKLKGQLDAVDTKVNAIDVKSGAAGYITVSEDEQNPGKFTVGLANEVATEFPAGFNFSQN
ncbi:MAG: hypothetical protein ACLRFJ_01125 [Alphaproteobacteria bacterium]